ncbi:MAG TPA: hypothetical protein VF005_05355 [Acidimicrobiales bacterium]
MITLPVVQLTGAYQVVSFNDHVQGQLWPIKVANESAYALQVQIAGNSHWLQPWTVDVFDPVQKVTQLAVTPTILTPPSITAPTPPSAALLITLAEEGERFPGTYPTAVARQVNFAIATAVAIVDTSNASFSFTPGTGAGGVQLQLTAQVAGPSVVTVTGRYSAKTYATHTFQAADPIGASFSVANLDPLDLGNPNGISITNNSNAQLECFALIPNLAFVYNNPTNPIYTSLNTAQPAPWQAPLQRPQRIAQVLTLGSANAVQLIAAAAGKSIYMFGVYVGFDSSLAGALHLVDGNPASGGVIFDDVSAVVFQAANANAAEGALVNNPARQYGGAPLTQGNGLWIWADGAGPATVTIRGSVSFNQA